MLKDLTDILIEDKIVKGDVLQDFLIPESLKKSLKLALSEQRYSFNDYTSYTITDSNKSNIAIIPNQYFVLASLIFEFATELYKYFEIFEELRPNAKFLLGTASEIDLNFKSGKIYSKKLNTNLDHELFCAFLDKDNARLRLGAKRLVDDQGKPRGSRDCFGSIILKSINLPDSSSSIFGSLVYDLAVASSAYKDLKNTYLQQQHIPKQKDKAVILNRTTTKLSKPFILLAGISGTGKTRFIRKQAEASAEAFRMTHGENYCLVPVRPDWHEPSDLLGYISRLNGVEYVATDFLKFVFKAFCSAIDDVSENSVSWKDPEEVPPYWLCLDEMNLAPVEQYFADYLSIIETRKWENGEYSSEPLLKKNIFDDLGQNGFTGEYSLGNKPPSGLTTFFNGILSDITIDEDLKKRVIHYVTNKGLPLPPNLIVAGTVNMDETTHGFSRKVIDRALTFDFGEFFPNDFDAFFEPESKPVLLSYPVYSAANKATLQSVPADSDGAKSVLFLKAVNGILQGTPFELAYRALNELLLSVVSFAPADDTELQAVWDDFLMCKVLPRIEGDHDKLTTVNQDETGDTILDQLQSRLSTEMADIWDDSERPDLLRDSTSSEGPILIHCRSKKKLGWMKSRLEKNTFTSFWP